MLADKEASILSRFLYSLSAFVLNVTRAMEERSLMILIHQTCQRSVTREEIGNWQTQAADTQC